MYTDIRNSSPKEATAFIASIFVIILLSSCTREKGSPVESEVLEVPKDQKCDVVLHDKNAGTIIDDSIDLEVLAQGFEIAEGPLWVASKKMLLFSDVKGNKIYSWTEEDGLNTFLSPGGHTEIAPYFEGGVLGSNGLALDLQGNLIICQHGDRRLAKLSLDNVSQQGVSNLVDKFEGKRFNSPNDLTVAPNGDIYFTDPPYGFCDIANSDPSKAEMLFVEDLEEIPFCGIYRYEAATGNVSLISDKMELPTDTYALKACVASDIGNACYNWLCNYTACPPNSRFIGQK